MTTKIHLQETSSTITDFTNYKVILLFRKVGTSPDLGASPTSIILTTTNTGVANFNQDNIQVDGNINISVISPAGTIISTKDIDKNELIGQASFQLDYIYTRVNLNDRIVQPSGMMTGRLLDASGKRNMDEIQIVIFASSVTTPDQFLPLLTVTTETGGYFFASYPQGKYRSAHALVGIESVSGKNNIGITLDNNENGEGVFPKKLLLVMEQGEINELLASKADCSCEDFNLHGPKRILDEFSYYSIIRTSDPEIKAYSITETEEISLDDLLKVSPMSSNPIVDGIIADPVRVFGHPVISPNFHSVSTLIANVTPNTTAPFATPAAHVLSTENISQALKNIKIRKSVVRDFMDKYKVLNKDTYLNLLEMNDAAKVNDAVREIASVPLGRAALNSQNIVDWDNDPTIYQSTSIAYGHLLHFKQQWVADGYSLGDLVYSLPLAPGQKKQIVVFDWERRESASNIQEIDYEESLDNSLSRDRDINEIASGVVNEKLNGSSSSTVKSASAGFGASIGPLVLGASGGISKGSSTATQNSMRDTAVRDSQHLSDKTVQSANAVRSQRSTVVQTVSQGERYEVNSESVANYNHCHALTIQYFEVLRHFKVQHKLVEAQECLFIPLPISTFDIDKARRWKEILTSTLRDKQLKKSFNALQRVKDHWEHSDFPATTFAAENILNLTSSLKIKIELTCPADKLEEQTRTVTMPLGSTYQEKYTVPVYDDSKWSWMSELLGMNSSDFYNSYIKDQTNRDKIFRDQLGDKISQKIAEFFEFKIVDNNGRDLPLTLDATLASSYHNGVPLLVSIRSGLINIPREKFIYFQIRLKANISLPPFTKILVVSGSANYRTKHMTNRLFNYSGINDDLGPNDNVMIYCGPTHEEMLNPKEEDVESVNNLINHLNANLEYYHKMMWLYMTPERRFMLLDGINLFIEKEQTNRSVASLVANKLIGIIGNSLVLPVIPGLNLNPDFAPKMLDEATGELVPLIDYYAHEPLDPLRVSVPTKGVFAEAMMGKCNSCEIKDEQRFWRWEESPIPDSPTAISPIVTPVPTVTQPNLQPAPLANPVVNIQNAPAIPDPQGLSGVMNLLGKGDTFRDLTGLTENQKNAIAGLQDSFDSTNKFGQMGLDLKKANLTRDIEAKKLDIEAQKAENENSMRQHKLNAMAQLLKDKVINKDDFDKYMATEGTSPELKNIVDANKAEKSGDITKDQKDGLIPKSTNQKIGDLKQKEAAINESVRNGSMSADKGKELIGKLYGDELNDASAKGYTPDDITAMTKAVAENKIGSLSATSDNVEISSDPEQGFTGGEVFSTFIHTESPEHEGYFEKIIFTKDFDSSSKLISYFVKNNSYDFINIEINRLNNESNVNFKTKEAIRSKVIISPSTKHRLYSGILQTGALANDMDPKKIEIKRGKPTVLTGGSGAKYLLPYGAGEKYKCNGAFGDNDHKTATKNFHSADLLLPLGTEIRAARSGTVIDIVRTFPQNDPDPANPGLFLRRDEKTANLIQILHEDETYGYYIHLKENGIASGVNIGSKIAAGSLLGYVGVTGNSNGPHLHFSVINGNYVSIPWEFTDSVGNSYTPLKGECYQAQIGKVSC